MRNPAAASEDGSCSLHIPAKPAPLVLKVKPRSHAGDEHPLRAEVDEAWARRCAENPRLFDGPVTRYLSGPTVDGEILACVDSYRRLAVGGEVHTGVLQLGVTGVLWREAGDGREVLLARRSEQTRVYGGLLELAPSGGVDLPPGLADGDRAATLGLDHVRAQFLSELTEELGLSAADIRGEPAWAAVCIDQIGRSAEIVMLARIDGQPTPASWEYTELRWVRPDATRDWTDAEWSQVIPPSGLMLRHMDLIWRSVDAR